MKLTIFPRNVLVDGFISVSELKNDESFKNDCCEPLKTKWKTIDSRTIEQNQRYDSDDEENPPISNKEEDLEKITSSGNLAVIDRYPAEETVKSTYSKDLSPPRLKKAKVPNDSLLEERDKDLSPPRQKATTIQRDSVSNSTKKDLAPPRRPSQRKMNKDSENNTLKNDKIFESKTGSKEFKTIYRDANGKILKELKTNDQDPEQNKIENKFRNISRGLKQIKEYEENQKILEAEKNVEYAFSASQNKKADQILKQKIHSEDPMADFFRSKEQKYNQSKAEKDTETNNNVYAASVQNRFGIKPGQRWDGVDRSNGFEKRIMNKSNEKIAEINRRYSQSYDL